MSIPSVDPDPSMIGGVSKAPFALMPDPGRLFAARSLRFAVLSNGSRLSPYLEFLSGLVRAQGEVASALPPLPLLPEEQRVRARAAGMPPIDRTGFANDDACLETLERFLQQVEDLQKPPVAAEALAQLRAADAETRGWMIGNVAADTLPMETLAHHLYVAAAVQVHAARLAAGLDAAALVPVSIGVCPACGGKPVASLVVGFQGAEGARYAVCACCSTQWNEVRVKCLACGSTKGVGYRSVESGHEDATIKAEVCDNCHSWTKMLYQNKNPSLEAVADDVASLGLDLLMKETEYRRAGFNPFLVGY